MNSSHTPAEAADSPTAPRAVPVAEVEVIAGPEGQGPDTGPADETGEARDPGEDLARALEDLRQAEERADIAHQSYLRAVADLDNYRKRMRREQENIASQAAARTVGSLLPVLDSFDAALGLEVSSEQEQTVLSGLKATYDLFLGTLQNQGLEIITATGEVFSPEVHEPINAPPPGEGELMVVTEVRRGYRLKGRLLRAALVMVARGSESG